MVLSVQPCPANRRAAAKASSARFRLGSWACCGALCWALCLPRPGLAQGGLGNGDFARDLWSWQVPATPFAAAHWVPEDLNGASDSGAAAVMLRTGHGGGPQVALTQCIALTGVGFPLPTRASARIASHDGGALQALLLLQEFSDTACQHAAGPPRQRLINAGRPNWNTLQFNYQPSVRGVGSLQVSLAVDQAAGMPSGGRVLFDGLQCGIPPRAPALRLHLLSTSAPGRRPAAPGSPTPAHCSTQSITEPAPASQTRLGCGAAAAVAGRSGCAIATRPDQSGSAPATSD